MHLIRDDIVLSPLNIFGGSCFLKHEEKNNLLRMIKPIDLHKFIDQEYHREDAIGLGDDDDPLWVVC